jgi:hypothetical protein
MTIARWSTVTMMNRFPGRMILQQSAQTMRTSPRFTPETIARYAPQMKIGWQGRPTTIVRSGRQLMIAVMTIG